MRCRGLILQNKLPEIKEQKKNVLGTMAIVLSWLFGILFLVAAIAGYGSFVERRFNGDALTPNEYLLILEGTLPMAMAAFVLPPIRKYAHRKTGKLMMMHNRLIILASLYVCNGLAHNIYNSGFSFSKISQASQLWFWCVLVIMAGYSLHKRWRGKNRSSDENAGR